MKNLLHPDGKILAVYFPPGLPERGGSCAFASMTCLVHCLSYLMNNSVTKETFNAFQEYDDKKLDGIVDKSMKILEKFINMQMRRSRTELIDKSEVEQSKKIQTFKKPKLSEPESD